MQVSNFCVPCFLIVLCVFQQVSAEEKAQHPLLSDKYFISLGAILTDSDGDVRSTIKGRREISLDLDDLDVADDDTSIFARAGWRFAKRWMLQFDYYDYETDGDRTASWDFNFRDLVISGNANVRTDVDIGVYIAQLFYFPIQHESYEIGLGLGVYAMDFQYDISATLNPTTAPVEAGSSKDDFIAPVPTISGLWNHAWTDRLATSVRVSWFGAEYDDYEGDFWAGSAYGEYAFTKRMRFGVGYNLIDIDIEDDSGNTTQEYEVELQGPFAYLRVGF